MDSERQKNAIKCKECRVTVDPGWICQETLTRHVTLCENCYVQRMRQLCCVDQNEASDHGTET
ncbi:unnamed protein product [marine sediment metagenome]|uniref:Uncharacterized protein n=1 Tax=marine sediment metagenome TaxID=412755 RepID=X0S9Z1_9ZZZZ